MGDRSPLVIGLLGGVASGKSRVAALLGERGAVVLDADRLAHEELMRGEVRAEIESAFGSGVIGRDGTVDRGALGVLVFGDPGRLERLEAILHPRVMSALAARIARERSGEGDARRVVVLDAPLLVEAGGLDWCDERVFVAASLESRALRARSRGWADGEVARREARQRPLAEKRAAATAVIENDCDPAALAAQVEDFWCRRVRPRLGVAEAR